MSNPVDPPGQYASSPCFAHELDASAHGFVAVDEQTRRDVMRWRRAERDRLVNARIALTPDERQRLTDCMVATLDALLASRPAPIVSVYWPIKGEPDLRPWMSTLAARGIRVVLPVVATRDAPMVFREWTPNCQLVPGIWKIPVPADGAHLTPSLIVSPVVGFDEAGFRLGNGGGYFDRTLAALRDSSESQTPEVVGVGYSFQALATIFPLPHDIPMDIVVTEKPVPLFFKQ